MAQKLSGETDNHMPSQQRRKEQSMITIKNTSFIAFGLTSILCGTSLSMSGCTETEDGVDSEIALVGGEEIFDGERVIIDMGFEETSMIDPETGEPFAMNFTPAPLAEANQTSFRGLALGYQDVWDGSLHEEVRIDMWSQAALVGIGARVTPERFSTLLLRGREVKPDGTLGANKDYRGGDDPNHILEAYCEAPVDHLIVGLGARVNNYNLVTLTIWYRKYIPVSKSLGEQVYSKSCGTQAAGSLERRIVAWEHIPDPGEEDRTVLNGISVRENDDNLTSLRARLRFTQ